MAKAPTDPRELGLARKDLAEVLRKRGRTAEAIAEYERAIEAFRTLPSGLEEAYGHFGLARILHIRGRAAEAEDRYTKALAILGREPARAPTRLLSSTLDGLGGLHLEQGHLSEALAVFTRLLDLTRQSQGTESLQSGLVLIQLADTLKLQHHYAKAAALYSQALLVLELHLPRDHGLLGAVLITAADCNRKLGYENLAREQLARAKKIGDRRPSKKTKP